MTETPPSDRGAIITYLVTDDGSEHGELRRAVVTGIGVADPDTDVMWVPVVRPDCELTLLDPALIVNTAGHQTPRDRSPGRLADAPSPGPVDVLVEALGMLAGSLAELDERLPSALSAAQDLLAGFVYALIPVEPALCLLVQEEPDGGLATVLNCIALAAEEFECGNVVDGKVGILLASATLEELRAGPDEPG
jgi:hypothetical protein